MNIKACLHKLLEQTIESLTLLSSMGLDSTYVYHHTSSAIKY